MGKTIVLALVLLSFLCGFRYGKNDPRTVKLYMGKPMGAVHEVVSFKTTGAGTVEGYTKPKAGAEVYFAVTVNDKKLTPPAQKEGE